jgi:hypothetical protein
MAKRKGGGIFVDDITGNWTILTKSLYSILFLAVIGGISYVLYLVFSKSKRDGPVEPERHSVGPNMNRIPGTVDIASVAQGPSAGQAIIYFSKHEAGGTTCDTCEVEFSINLSYSGGSSVPSPTPTIVTAPLNSGNAMVNYGIPEPYTHTPPLPTPPTSVRLDITARVTDPTNPSNSGRPTSFSKTLPYVA